MDGLAQEHNALPQAGLETVRLNLEISSALTITKEGVIGGSEHCNTAKKSFTGSLIMLLTACDNTF